MSDRREELCGLLARIGARTKEAKAARVELSGEADRLYDTITEGLPASRYAAANGDPEMEDSYLQNLRDRRMIS